MFKDLSRRSIETGDLIRSSNSLNSDSVLFVCTVQIVYQQTLQICIVYVYCTDCLPSNPLNLYCLCVLHRLFTNKPSRSLLFVCTAQIVYQQTLQICIVCVYCTDCLPTNTLDLYCLCVLHKLFTNKHSRSVLFVCTAQIVYQQTFQIFIVCVYGTDCLPTNPLDLYCLCVLHRFLPTKILDLYCLCVLHRLFTNKPSRSLLFVCTAQIVYQQTLQICIV